MKVHPLAHRLCFVAPPTSVAGRSRAAYTFAAGRAFIEQPTRPHTSTADGWIDEITALRRAGSIVEYKLVPDGSCRTMAVHVGLSL